MTATTPASDALDARRTDISTFGPAEVLDLFTRLVTIRAFEERVEAAHKAGALYGPFHSSVGQEAIAVGACAALRPHDVVTSTHRGHGHVIAKGGDLARMCAELWGRAAGYNRGKGGSMHLASSELGLLGQNGIVGASLFLAAGAALGHCTLGVDRVAVAFSGDGSVGQGVFHETLNLAAIWKLPVVFVIENNAYAHSMPVGEMQLTASIAMRAAGYGIAGTRVDGTDLLAVHAVMTDAVAVARAGGGPMLVEAMCYRWRGHNLGDADHRYRAREEVAKAREIDPIEIFRRDAGKIVSEAELDNATTLATRRVEAAIAFADDAPTPDPAWAFEDTI
jgi:TPP-dependent pyruvate/acetoin dehydrogenase alpha subunit